MRGLVSVRDSKGRQKLRPGDTTAHGSIVPRMRKAPQKDITQPNTFCCPNPNCTHVFQSKWTEALPKNSEEQIDWTAPNQSFSDNFVKFNMKENNIDSENKEGEPKKLTPKSRMKQALH